MRLAPHRGHLADAADWRARGGERGRLVAAATVVTAVHLLVFVRYPAALPPAPEVSASSAISLDLLPGSFLVETMVRAPQPTPIPAPPTPDPPLAKQTPPSAPPTPPQPAPIPSLEALTPPPLDPTAEPMQLAPSPTFAPSTAAGQVALAGANSSCDLTAPIQLALQQNPKVRDELAAIPRQARSVADAVQLWDGAWIGAGAADGPSTPNPVRDAIVAVINQASATCHDQTVVGPRLFAVTDPRGTIVVVVGSGQWKWSDLLEQPAAAPTN